MNLENAKFRLLKAIQKSAVSVSDADFLATHVPFSKISLARGYEGRSNYELLDEDGIFSELFEKRKLNDHQLDIVLGDPGSGKSHLIKWLYTKLRTVGDVVSQNAICIINRASNTLRGTIEQLLRLEDLQGIQNRESYQRLLNAQKIPVKEEVFLDSIYDAYTRQVQHDERNYLSFGIDKALKQNLFYLLKSESFKNFLERKGGPLRRIKSKVIGDEDANVVCEQDIRFVPDDFVLTEKLKAEFELDPDQLSGRASDLLSDIFEFSDGDRSAKEKVQKICNLLNSFTEYVISTITNIELGSMTEIFRDIRTYLASQGKGLILFIEDINSLSGISGQLLDALAISQAAEGPDSELCRIISVIGSTTQYFDDFRDHFKDRVTYRIEVGSNSLYTGKEKLYLFFAKYLNAISLSHEELETWRSDGAEDDKLPVHMPTEETNTDFYTLPNGKKISLYPFTKKAIERMATDHDGDWLNPRRITQDIIFTCIDTIITRGKELYLWTYQDDNLQVSPAVRMGVPKMVEQLSMPEDEKKRYRERLIKFISIYSTTDGLNSTATKICGIPRKLFDEFGFGAFEKIMSPDSTDEPEESEATPIAAAAVNDSAVQVKRTSSVNESKFKDFVKSLDDWAKGHKFQSWRFFQEFMQTLSDAIYWQDYGIPIWIGRKIFSRGQYGNYYAVVEGSGMNNGAITIKRDDGYAFLYAFGQIHYLGADFKNLNFEGSTEAIFEISSWLFRNVPKIVEKGKRLLGVELDSLYEIYAAEFLLYEAAAGRRVDADGLKDTLLEKISGLGPETLSFRAQAFSQYINDPKTVDLAEHARKSLLNSFLIFPPGSDGEIDDNPNETQRGYIDFLGLEKAISDARKKDCNPRENFDGAISFAKQACDDLKKMRGELEKRANSELAYDADSLEALYSSLFDPSIDKMDISGDSISDIFANISEFYENVRKTLDLTTISFNERQAACLKFRSRSSDLASWLKQLPHLTNETNLLKKLRGLNDIDNQLLSSLADFIKSLENDIKIVENNVNGQGSNMNISNPFTIQDDSSGILGGINGLIADALNKIGR